MKTLLGNWLVTGLVVSSVIAAPVLLAGRTIGAAPRRQPNKVVKVAVTPQYLSVLQASYIEEQSWNWNGQDRTMVDRTPVGPEPPPGMYNGIVSNVRTVAQNLEVGREGQVGAKEDASPPGFAGMSMKEFKAFELGQEVERTQRGSDLSPFLRGMSTEEIRAFESGRQQVARIESRPQQQSSDDRGESRREREQKNFRKRGDLYLLDQNRPRDEPYLTERQREYNERSYQNKRDEILMR